MDLRTQAELYRRGLVGRYVTVDEAIAWADSVIAAEDRPPIDIIELASAGGQDAYEAAKALEPFTAGIPANALLPETVAFMRATLEREEQRASAVAWSAYEMSLDQRLPTHADLPELCSVWYEFDPDEAQWASSRADALEYLRTTLERLARALEAAV